MAFTWIVSGCLALLTCAIAFFVMGWIDYRNAQDRLTDELVAKSLTVSRRLSGELLLGQSGAAASVTNALKAELALSKVELAPGLPCDGEFLSQDYCTQRKAGELLVLRTIPHVQRETHAVISSPLPPFFTIGRFSLFFLSVIPIALVLAFALALQRYFIGKYLLKPVGSLVDTSTGAQSPQEHWPKEIMDIANKLSTSFEAREQAIYGQIARGVIHDVRTLLHSVLSATKLVKEQEGDPTKRHLRLETLFRASETNLPKINELIDLTLDGSREIPVAPRTHDIAATVRSAIKTNEALSATKNVVVRMADFPEHLLLSHDPVQLERVFTNLIKNGIEACAESGSHQLPGSVLISAHLHDSSKTVSIAVEDSGRGLPQDPEKVFRLLKSTKVHGSGLGLVVSRKIVQSHGGELIPDKSDRLRGAKFEVKLPLSGTGAST